MEENNNVDKERIQRQIEAHNNANNIRNAANLAASSKNPYVRAAGGALKAADKLTNGKASEKLGSAQEKLNRHNPLKNNVQNPSNKSPLLKSDTGGNKPKSSDIGSNNLKNSLANRARNIMNNRRKKKGDNQDDNSSSQVSNSENDEEGKEKTAAVRKLVIKVVISAVLFLAPILLIAVIVASVASYVGSFIPLLGNILFGEKGYTFEYYEEDYYEELKKVGEDFKNQCDTELNTNYLHVALMYSFYLEGTNPEKGEYEGMKDSLIFMKEDIVDHLINDEDIDCNVSYEKGGNLYNLLLNYGKYQQRYSQFVDGTTYTYDGILNEIFDLAETVTIEEDEPSAIPDDLEVTGISSNNVPVKEYLAGVIYANVDKSILTNPEKIKAYTIAYTTNILSKNNISVNTQSISNDTLKDINYCDINGNCNGKGNASDIIKNNINSSIEEVYGNVLVNSSGKYDALSIDSLQNAAGNTYNEILKNAYASYSLRDAREDVYDNGVNYGNEKVLTNVVFYDQTNYANYKFCGLKNETIATSGCGTTAMAMIASTYENNRKYDPVYMAEEARKGGYCSKGNGTYYGLFKHEANVLGYKYLTVRKTTDANKLNIITSHLKKGHLIVVHMGKGKFTNGGHYMVLGGIDPETKSVYVYDPYNARNSVYRKTGNGWYSFNDILKEVKPAKDYLAFQIIWKE